MKCRPFKTWCLQNFPFIENDFDALTNYELMCKIVEYIKKVAKDVKELTDEYNKLVDGFQELYDYVNEYLTDLDDVKESIILINNRLDDLATDVLANTNRIESVNDTLTALINNNFTLLKNYIDARYNQLDNKIDNIQIGLINIYDPMTGQVEPLQTVINNIYNVLNTDGITASEFDALDLTVTAFEAYQITAYNFDSQSKTILV